MNARGISPNKIDPRRRTAAQSAGHKIVSLTIGDDDARTFGYQGSVRTDDGINVYDYDEKQHLIAVTQKWQFNYTRVRRIVFEYDGRRRCPPSARTKNRSRSPHSNQPSAPSPRTAT